ncbi:MAG: phosphoribosylanthranilate isomerase [Ruminococcus sp.]|nr:phosphoribosylanthranilate isomerase [Ruminococcus sp.]
MTKIKMCGLSRTEDIKFANHIMPEFVGFVFYEKSSRYVDSETAAELRWELDYRIAAVGVFVDAPVSFVADLARREVIDAVQLHGSENNEYIAKLRSMVDVPIIQAFRVSSPYDIESAVISDADFVLLDSGTGTGKTFDHSLIKGLNRPYFLAGGITPENVREAAEKLHPYAVDASSSLEIDGVKSFERMKAFAEAVRN